MTQQIAPILPTLDLTINGRSENHKPVATTERSAEMTVCYKLGRHGQVIIKFYTLGLGRLVETRRLDPKAEQIEDIQQTYLEQVVAKMLTDLVIGKSDLWPVHVKIDYSPNYSPAQWDNEYPAWLEMMTGQRRQGHVHLELKDVPNMPAEQI